LVDQPREKEIQVMAKSKQALKDAVVVITGAGSGIGQALAVEFAGLGTRLALADVNEAGLKQTVSLLGSAEARSYQVDVSDAAAVESFAQQVRQDFGTVSILVNNAGVALHGNFADLTLAEFDWLMNINFWGVIHGCKFFLPLLRSTQPARIVNVSSVFGLIGPPGQTAYSSSKFAIRGFSESLREELRSTGISVTCVHPAGIATNIAAKARAGQHTEVEGQAVALKIFAKAARITPQEAAITIVQGILKDKDRVLIGNDARRMDWMARIFPERAGAMFADYMAKRRRKLTGETRP
jgi:NAD(P)-dependent dehydrogenase (short-subunit alcohol dehydrogenase family)